MTSNYLEGTSDAKPPASRNVGETSEGTKDRVRVSLDLDRNLHTLAKIVAARRHSSLISVFSSFARALEADDDRATAILDDYPDPNPHND